MQNVQSFIYYGFDAPIKITKNEANLVALVTH